MAEPLRDLRAKVDTHTWIWLEAESQATGRDISEIVRGVLQSWADKKFHAANVAQRLMAGEGMKGITGEREG